MKPRTVPDDTFISGTCLPVDDHQQLPACLRDVCDTLAIQTEYGITRSAILSPDLAVDDHRGSISDLFSPFLGSVGGTLAVRTEYRSIRSVIQRTCKPIADHKMLFTFLGHGGDTLAVRTEYGITCTVIRGPCLFIDYHELFSVFFGPVGNTFSFRTEHRSTRSNRVILDTHLPINNHEPHLAFVGFVGDA